MQECSRLQEVILRGLDCQTGGGQSNCSSLWVRLLRPRPGVKGAVHVPVGAPVLNTALWGFVAMAVIPHTPVPGVRLLFTLVPLVGHVFARADTITHQVKLCGASAVCY